MSALDGEMFDPGDIQSILSELTSASKGEEDPHAADLLRRAELVIRNQQRIIGELSPKQLRL